jgi:hypothetical protein
MEITIKFDSNEEKGKEILEIITKGNIKTFIVDKQTRDIKVETGTNQNIEVRSKVSTATSTKPLKTIPLSDVDSRIANYKEIDQKGLFLSDNELKTLVSDFESKGVGRDKIKAIINNHNYSKLSEIKPNDFNTILAEIVELLPQE